MTKLLLCADLHIHNHKNSDQRLQNCLDVLNWVFETAKKNNIKNICFLGDLFHSRQKINVAVYQHTFEIFCKWMKHENHPNVYLLLGNHDIVHRLKCNISSVKPFSSIDGIQVVDHPCTIDINNFAVSFLPYTINPSSDIAKLNNQSEFKILLGHLAVDGAILNSVYQTISDVVIEHDGDMEIVDNSTFDSWNQVFLGHYHGEQLLSDNIEYIGSPLQLSFGETSQKKHIIVYDLDTHEKNYIENTFSPKHYIIDKDEIDEIDITNNFVKVMVEDISSSELIDFRNSLNEQSPATLDIRQKNDKTTDQKIVDDALATILKNDNILEKYVEFMDDVEELNGLDKDKLLNIGKEIVQQATNKMNQ